MASDSHHLPLLSPMSKSKRIEPHRITDVSWDMYPERHLLNVNRPELRDEDGEGGFRTTGLRSPRCKLSFKLCKRYTAFYSWCYTHTRTLQSRCSIYWISVWVADEMTTTNRFRELAAQTRQIFEVQAKYHPDATLKGMSILQFITADRDKLNALMEKVTSSSSRDELDIVLKTMGAASPIHEEVDHPNSRSHAAKFVPKSDSN
ncbi:hypothetical protein DFP72DRAFT_847301 [Ephemerocybe angulata]|uniref:Uncharacterized protein n=1 Tax=Ephemerocybe angulata TaxID=980116 RepID=A0A8H6M4P8_9AGAR|nr:hypothetical protein DFP72DRAFT_847301 [Tulosesus angulatus]